MVSLDNSHVYAELHCKTNFSFLEGASHADELIARAKQLEYAAIAVTDRNTLAGVVRAHTAAKKAELKLLIGAEIVPVDGPPAVLWATDRSSYGRLSRLITRGRRRAVKGECELTVTDIAEHSEGLLAGIVTCVSSESKQHRSFHEGGTASVQTQTTSLPSDERQLVTALNCYRDIFGQRGYLLVELLLGSNDQHQLDQHLRWSRLSKLPLLAAGDVHYHIPARLALHDVLTAIRHGVPVEHAGDCLYSNAQRHLRTLKQISMIYQQVPSAMRRTLEVASRCTFSLEELRYEYPEELAPADLTPMQHLVQQTWEGALWRYPGGIPEKVKRLLEHELTLIEELRYEAYFLTVWDLVRFARSRGILCQGRGSAANSAVCYCLGVTAVDPDQADLLFERFVSRERNEAPDIDVDFEHDRREEVLQYLYDKYGRQRAGMTATLITYRCRSAVRDVGKALGLSLDRVDALAKNLEGYTREPLLAKRCQQVGLNPHEEMGRSLVHLVNELIGFPRHLSQHVGGMVMTQGPLCELVPIENAAMDGRTVIQWDKNDLDDLGILKVDCLALGMLTAIRKCFELVKQHTGRRLTLANIPPDDKGVYQMICRADTIGVFQIESRAQMSMLPRLRPQCYYDLVIEVAIVRPGPIQGQMVHPFLRRRIGDEDVTYPNDDIRDVLHKTLGVTIFQEQAMRLAVVAAGFTPGEADQLRRAMGAWRRPGVIDQFRRKLLEGMKQRGLSQTFAEQVFMQIRGFGEYGFPESHAASFALLVYVAAWLKHHYPAAFTAALLNSQPMGFYAPAQLIRDAREHGVRILPVDVNTSDWDCTLEPNKQGTDVKNKGKELEDQSNPDRSLSTSPPLTPFPQSSLSLRLGFRLLGGVSKRYIDNVEKERQQGGLFSSLSEFTKRTRLSRSVIKQLAEADVFASLGRDRRTALWEALAQEQTLRELPLFGELAVEDEETVCLPEMNTWEQVVADYATTGLSLRAHPISFCRQQLDRLKVLTSDALPQVPNNRHIRVAGLVLLRQRPSTAKGITFVTIEDETGVANLVVRQPIWQHFHQVARHSPAWIAHGKLECKYSVIHIVVNRIEDLSQRIGPLSLASRDFR